ncbi:MerR family transcriptional regulator [Altererythrobacter soli]|uniref:MerR family transcriptional regulator n=1 Tax=Croceibacterium soli TaxID=1739690 RepID=A0A6I4UQB3_9SPHN|nr:MerR family transcriptional regulator [Croceibacterium soli]MXP41170.1 MerR family transcriptional regulator [Croceibacterium soli]
MSEGGPDQLRFDDGKDAQALRTIGEVANALGIRQHVLRYWEQQFPMLEPLKRSGGRRYYRPDDVALVRTIDRLVNREGYTLKGARQAIAGGTAARSASVSAPAPAPAAEAAAPAPDILPQLRAIRNRLARALDAA